MKERKMRIDKENLIEDERGKERPGKRKRWRCFIRKCRDL